MWSIRNKATRCDDAVIKERYRKKVLLKEKVIFPLLHDFNVDLLLCGEQYFTYASPRNPVF